MAIELSEDVINNLLEDRRNGMGLQKAARKYKVGVARIRKIEKEEGLEVAIPSSEPLRIHDVEEHFKETRESFAALQKQLAVIESLFRKQPMDNEEILEEQSMLEEGLEKIEKEINWGYVTGGVGLIIGVISLFMSHRMFEEKMKPLRAYTPPTEELPKDLPKKNSKVPEME